VCLPLSVTQAKVVLELTLVEPFFELLSKNWLLTMSTMVMVRQKLFIGTNTLAYYAAEIITVVKSFTIQFPELLMLDKEEIIDVR
jgi:hypothetical protein